MKNLERIFESVLRESDINDWNWEADVDEGDWDPVRKCMVYPDREDQPEDPFYNELCDFFEQMDLKYKGQFDIKKAKKAIACAFDNTIGTTWQ